MEKQRREEDSDPAPPYEESITSRQPTEKSTQVHPSPLTTQERIAEIRQQRVKLLVDGHVEQLIENAILHGSNQTIFIVPSDALTTSNVLTPNNLVHRPKTTATDVIQLQGPNSTSAFWTQARVVEELQNAMRHMLYAMTGTAQSTDVLPPRPADLSSPVTGQKSWFKKTFGMPGPEHDPTGSTGQWKLGWRSEDENSQHQHAPNQFFISVRAKEVAFRTETELGLLATTTAKCIVIELDCGC